MIGVKLWDMNTLMLIIPASTGIIYENQTWGTTCFNDFLEGMLIPTGLDFFEDNPEAAGFDLESLFPEGGHGFIDRTRAENIEKRLSAHVETEGIKVNWKKIDQSHEAWLHVIVSDGKFTTYSGLNGREAVFTWPNRD